MTIGKKNEAIKIYNEGVDAGRAGNNDESVRKYTEAISIDPSFVDAHYNLGIIYRDNKDYNSSIKHFNEAIKYDPKDASIYCELATSLFKNDDFDGAKKTLKKSIEINPTYSLSYANLGVLYTKSIDPASDPDPEKMPQTIEDIERVIEIAECYAIKAMEFDPTNTTAISVIKKVGTLRKFYL